MDITMKLTAAEYSRVDQIIQNALMNIRQERTMWSLELKEQLEASQTYHIVVEPMALPVQGDDGVVVKLEQDNKTGKDHVVLSKTNQRKEKVDEVIPPEKPTTKAK